MLNSDQAEKELQKHRVEEWHKDRLAALRKLPAASRKVARPLVGINDDGDELPYEEHGKLRDEVVPLATALTAGQRVDLFEALFPGLGAAVEAGWQLHHELPHSMGGLEVETKSFRIRDDDTLLLKRRLRWVESL